MPRRFLGYGRQSVDRSDIDAVVEVLQSDFLTQGPTIERFEAALAERCSARHAVAVSNGTAALHLACLAAGIGPGDVGLTSAITFAASANCVRYAGGEATFADIDPATLGLSPRALERALADAPQIKAILPVDLAGLADRSAEIRELAGDRVVIEDAAHAIGGTYADGRPIGCCAHSDMTIFSFHPVKLITTAEGGAVMTNDAEFARRVRLLRSHGIERDPSRFSGAHTREGGRVKPWLGEQQMLGFNYRITDLHAALGISQLAKLDRFLQRRRTIARRYDEGFRNLPAVFLPQSSPAERARSGHHLYIVVLDFDRLRTTRTELMTRLAERGIGSQVHYVPVYHHPYYENRYDIDHAKFPAAEQYYRGCLSLPFFPGLTDEEVEHVVATFTEVLGGA
jgi:UDP-4-amino-4,6-dideoxy-N-acetyl-beta-L-altrosamine transaminase